MKAMCPKYGYAADMKEYRKNPDAFNGNVSDLSTMIRVAVTGRANSPDLQIVMQLLGYDRVRERLARAVSSV